MGVSWCQVLGNNDPDIDKVADDHGVTTVRIVVWQWLQNTEVTWLPRDMVLSKPQMRWMRWVCIGQGRIRYGQGEGARGRRGGETAPGGIGEGVSQHTDTDTAISTDIHVCDEDTQTLALSAV